MKVNNAVDFYDWLHGLPQPEPQLVLYFHELIMELVPGIEQRFTYGAPFYYLTKRLFYIWPASVPWGGLKSGVMLGFCVGTQLSNDDHYLQGEDKKTVRHVIYSSLKAAQSDVDRIKLAIFESIEV